MEMGGMRFIFVGLSGKIVDKAFDVILTNVPGAKLDKANLVPHAPMRGGKIRYPNQQEMEQGWRLLARKMAQTKVEIVILLGRQVADFVRPRISIVDVRDVEGRFVKWAATDGKGRVIVAAAHPSYVGVYARKHIDDYAQEIFKMAAQAWAMREEEVLEQKKEPVRKPVLR